jgi:uncharacterized protein YfiM (DUF2279 family)
MKALLLLALATSAHGACLKHDRWTGYDKNLHLTAGSFIGAGVTAQTGNALLGAAAGAGVGALKEAYDSRGNGTCSVQDFAVTALGAAFGAYGSKWLLTHQAGKTSLTYSTEF